MPSTKIINVMKDDKFEEILDIFKNTQAKEVIFVLPKKNNALKDEEHFIILSNEAQKADKTVSLLCSNPEINALGKRYDFDILMPKPSSSSSNKSPNKPIMLVNQIEPDEQRDEEDNDIFEKEEKDENKLEQDGDEKEDDEEKKKNEDENLSPAVSRENRTSDDFDIITTSAPFKTNRSLSEIIKSKDEDKINIKIVQRKEQERGININKSQAEEKTNQIKSVWQFNDSYSES